MGHTDIQLKGLFGLLAGIMGYMLHCITELVIVLVFFMIIDYATGVTAAFVEKRLESRKSFVGAIKKVGYMVLLATAFFLDYIVSYLVNKAGIQSPINGMFGIATTCWLIGTEGLSILENLNSIGVPFPPFLRNAFKKLRNDSKIICEGKKGEK